MRIQKAQRKDLEAVLQIYELAKVYMRQQGNAHQWTGGYPYPDMVEEDIARGELYLCTEGKEILGVFCFFCRPDPTYEKIYEGQWLDDEPYGVIHRIAVTAHRRGVASACFDFALSQCPNLRIDTHHDNIPMQRSLAKNGFTRCGIIYIETGDPRIAYQKKV